MHMLLNVQPTFLKSKHMLWWKISNLMYCFLFPLCVAKTTWLLNKVYTFICAACQCSCTKCFSNAWWDIREFFYCLPIIGSEQIYWLLNGVPIYTCHSWNACQLNFWLLSWVCLRYINMETCAFACVRNLPTYFVPSWVPSKRKINLEFFKASFNPVINSASSFTAG